MNAAFKGQLEKDIFNVFFNNDEFSDYHLVDGKQMHVLFDEYELTKNDTSDSKVKADGVYKDLLLIYVPVSELGPKPKTGRVMILDGKKSYRVVDVMTEDGVYAIQLEAYRS